MLVIDRDPLQPIDLLHFVHKVLLKFLGSLDVQNVMRIRRPIHQRLTGLDPIALLHVQMLAFGDEIFLRVTHVITHNDFPHTLHVAAVFHRPINLVDHSVLFWLSRFE